MARSNLDTLSDIFGNHYVSLVLVKLSVEFEFFDACSRVGSTTDEDFQEVDERFVDYF